MTGKRTGQAKFVRPCEHDFNDICVRQTTRTSSEGCHAESRDIVLYCKKCGAFIERNTPPLEGVKLNSNSDSREGVQK